MREARTIVCIGGRCSSWGKNWRKHLYSGNEDCLRCGMSRKEQFEEDKITGTAWGEYKPAPPAKQNKTVRNPEQIMYCAVGDYGIEFTDPTETKVRKWIKEQSEENDFDADYYSIETFTKAELAAMPED